MGCFQGSSEASPSPLPSVPPVLGTGQTHNAMVGWWLKEQALGICGLICVVGADALLWEFCRVCAHASPRAADGLSLLLPPRQDVQEDQPQPPQNSPLPDGPVAATSTPQPVPAAGSQAEKAVPNKSLLDWLRQQSDYTLDVPSFGTVRVARGGTCVCLSVCVSAFCVALCVRFSAIALEFRASTSVSNAAFISTVACGVHQGYLGGSSHVWEAGTVKGTC